MMNKFIQKGKVREAKGSIVAPENSGLRFVLNPIDLNVTFKYSVNDVLAKKWKKVREEAKSWHANRSNFKLGELQSVAVQSDVWVLNLPLFTEAGRAPLSALEMVFKKIASLAKYEKASLHMTEEMFNMVGCQELANKYFINEGINLYLYKL